MLDPVVWPAVLAASPLHFPFPCRTVVVPWVACEVGGTMPRRIPRDDSISLVLNPHRCT